MCKRIQQTVSRIEFKESLSPDDTILLKRRFDSLFTLVTPCKALNERIKLIRGKKDKMITSNNFIQDSRNLSEKREE